MDEQMTIRDTNIVQTVYKEGFNDEYIPNGIYTGKQLKQMYLWNNASVQDVIHDLKYLYIQNENRVHTNLYYSILRLWFAGIDFNDIDYYIIKGCLLNIIFFCFAFFYMYKLLALLFKDDKISIAVGLIVAFLNTGTLTNLTFIREYYLQMTLFIILTYLILKKSLDYTNKKISYSLKNLILLSFITALTLLAGYYSIFYVLLLYIWLIINPIKNKDLKTIKFIIKAFAVSILFALLLYPLYFTGFFSHHGLSEIQANLSLHWTFKDYIFYTFNSIEHHLINFIFYYPILLICFILMLFPKSKNKIDTSKYGLELFIISLIFSVLIILLRQENINFYRYIVAIFPLLSIIIPYLCHISKFKRFFSGLFIILYLYAAFISPSNATEAKNKFYYAVKRYTYSIDREVMEKMQDLNLPIVIYEKNTVTWNKYKIIAYLRDENIFYGNSTDSIAKRQPYILLISNEKKYFLKSLPKYLENKEPNIIIPESHFVGYILIKD